MRRQTVLGGALPAGAGRCPRLDPMALPVRFTATDATADGRVRQVEIDRKRVLLQRRVCGMAIRFNLPIHAFQGVSVRLMSEEGGESLVVIRLEHRDPALGVELHAGADEADVVAKWQLWARVLALPLLIADRSGRLHDPLAAPAAATSGTPAPRRRRRNAIRKRRPLRPLRRRPGDPRAEQPVYREREIIART